MTIYQVHDYAREPSDGATEAPSLESENRHEAAVALMNLRLGVAEASLANPPSMREIIQRPSPPTLIGVMTRATRRQMANVTSSRNVRARTEHSNQEDEPNEATMNESMEEDQEFEAPPLDSDNSANRDMLDQHENPDMPSVNLSPSLSVRADHDNIEARDAHLSNENMPNEQSDGATIEEPMEEEEEEETVEFENASNVGRDYLQSAPDNNDAGGTAANENSASGEQGAYGILGAADNNHDATATGGTTANENPASGGVAENSNNAAGRGTVANQNPGVVAATGGTASQVLTVNAYESSSNASGVHACNHIRSFHIRNEVLRGRQPVTYNVGDFVLTIAHRGEQSITQRTRTSSQSYALAQPSHQHPANARGPPGSNNERPQARRRLDRRGELQLPLAQNRQNASAAGSHRRLWVALQVPGAEKTTCPFCRTEINATYRSALPCFNRCISVTPNDCVRVGILRRHSEKEVQVEGGSSYHCLIYGVATQRPILKKVKESLKDEDIGNIRKRKDLIRFSIVVISFTDTEKFENVMESIFIRLDSGIVSTEHDKTLMQMYINEWKGVLNRGKADLSEKNHYVRSIKQWCPSFVDGVRASEIIDIIDEVQQSVELLLNQVKQEDDSISPIQLESIVVDWLSNHVVTSDGITETLETSIAKMIFHRLNNIRQNSEIWRNRVPHTDNT